MYLKSIEVQGFKSFANKIVFDFHNGITGIVGPNGSGKSNVADAVRWVLGEQRVKQLRGGTMQDVIFSGTENRKPLSYAYVAITLDNSDHQLAIAYEEVTIARRLYRSGESEYLLNGTVCRLKDVQELFYDTGIGKEGYSIIGQGQIDRILSSKPEEARELFDEATGIVKFKKRKKNTEKKLEDEKQNLLRINDILTELEKQLAPLERQAEKAKEFLKKKEALKEEEIQIFLLEMEEIQQQLKKLQENKDIAQTQLQEANTAFENTKLEYERIEKELELMEIQIAKTKESISSAKLQKQQIKGQIAVLKEQVRSSDTNSQYYQERMHTLKEELQKKEAEHTQILSEQKELEQQVLEARTAQEEAQENYSDIHQRIADCQTNIENNKNEIIVLLNQRSSIKGKLQRYDVMDEQIQIRKAEINQKLIQIKSDELGQAELLQRREEKLQKVQKELLEKQEERSKVEQRIAKLQEQIELYKKQLEEGQLNYHRESSRLESLRNLAERYDGYGGSIRRVMEQKFKQDGICGVVADLIQTDKKYETAIEIALGGSIQNVVTKDEKTAKDMIAFLKQNHFGRVTFLPLTAMQNPPKFQQVQALKEDGVIGLAHTLIHTEAIYQKLIEQLLGRTLVVEQIDKAIALQKKYHYSLRIVTLEGESMNPGGAMTGGSFKNNSSLLSRNREIEELKESVISCKEQLETVQQQLLEMQKERTDCYTALDESAAILQEIRVRENTARLNVEQLKQQKESVSRRLLQLQNETLELERQKKEIEELRKQNQTELNDSEEKEKAHNFAVETYQARLEEEREKESTVAKVLEDCRLEMVSILQKSEFIHTNLQRVLGELEKAKEEQEELLISVQQADGEKKRQEKNIELFQQELTSVGESILSLEKKAEELQGQKEVQSTSHKEFFSKREKLSSQINELDKEVFRLQSQEEKLQETSEGLNHHMWMEYELTYHALTQYKKEEGQSLSKRKKMASSIKEEIKALGNVNVNAIEDFKEISERYQFMDTQRNDIQEAEKNLKQIIQELDSGMKKQFKEQFVRIQKEFDKVFKELFGGGKGTLELMDESDILETGVRIISQPPGKKLQNMMQLSGGEKALTAIALLFAIQNLKPSPFCLLDEIEAALDDSNVVRFASYLHKLTKHTQFIVITHRRGTMNAADRLYGITMQEKGVSTLVSVNLIENDLDK